MNPSSFIKSSASLLTTPVASLFSTLSISSRSTTLNSVNDCQAALIAKRWATKKAAGTTKNGRDSNPKYRGVKKTGGEAVIPGNIIIRQKGNKFYPGDGVGEGRDFTLYALEHGFVRFKHDRTIGKSYVCVEPRERYEQIAKIKAHDRARRSVKERNKHWHSWSPGISSNPVIREQQLAQMADQQKMLDEITKKHEEVKSKPETTAQ